MGSITETGRKIADALHKAGVAGLSRADLIRESGVYDNNQRKHGIDEIVIADGKGHLYHRKFAPVAIIREHDRRRREREKAKQGSFKLVPDAVKAARAQKLQEAATRASALDEATLTKLALEMDATARRNLFLRLGKSLVTKGPFGELELTVLSQLGTYIGRDVRLGSITIDEKKQRESAERLKGSGDLSHPLLEVLA